MGEGVECVFSNHSHPLSTLIYQFFPAYQCNTKQVVVKPVISAGEFHVSGKKLYLTKTEMGSEMQGTLKREMVCTNHEVSTESLL